VAARRATSCCWSWIPRARAFLAGALPVGGAVSFFGEGEGKMGPRAGDTRYCGDSSRSQRRSAIRTSTCGRNAPLNGTHDGHQVPRRSTVLQCTHTASEMRSLRTCVAVLLLAVLSGRRLNNASLRVLGCYKRSGRLKEERAKKSSRHVSGLQRSPSKRKAIIRQARTHRKASPHTPAGLPVLTRRAKAG
jgi:hypothetical protein